MAGWPNKSGGAMSKIQALRLAGDLDYGPLLKPPMHHGPNWERNAFLKIREERLKEMKRKEETRLGVDSERIRESPVCGLHTLWRGTKTVFGEEEVPFQERRNADLYSDDASSRREDSPVTGGSDLAEDTPMVKCEQSHDESELGNASELHTALETIHNNPLSCEAVWTRTEKKVQSLERSLRDTPQTSRHILAVTAPIWDLYSRDYSDICGRVNCGTIIFRTQQEPGFVSVFPNVFPREGLLRLRKVRLPKQPSALPQQLCLESHESDHGNYLAGWTPFTSDIAMLGEGYLRLRLPLGSLVNGSHIEDETAHSAWTLVEFIGCSAQDPG